MVLGGPWAPRAYQRHLKNRPRNQPESYGNLPKSSRGKNWGTNQNLPQDPKREPLDPAPPAPKEPLLGKQWPKPSRRSRWTPKAPRSMHHTYNNNNTKPAKVIQIPTEQHKKRKPWWETKQLRAGSRASPGRRPFQLCEASAAVAERSHPGGQTKNQNLASQNRNPHKARPKQCFFVFL